MSNIALARPYLMADWPQSDGRTFLAHAFAFFCMLEWGHSFEEMDAAFDPASGCDERVRGQVIGAAQNFGRVIQQGRIETYARPIGGGPPRLLPRSAWELDDFGWRFGLSAIDPSSPFDRNAEPTHWIFVDSRQFDDILGLVQGDAPRRGTTGPVHDVPPENSRAAGPAAAPASDRYLRKADVLKLVPMSRSTFDDRVRKGLFPASHDLGGGIVVWWESEVQEWMRGMGGRKGA